MDLQRQKNSEHTRANGAKSKCGELMKGKAKSKMWNTSVTLKKKKKKSGGNLGEEKGPVTVDSWKLPTKVEMEAWFEIQLNFLKPSQLKLCSQPALHSKPKV